MSTRPLSIAHLVFGLIFLGVTALWVIGAATDADSGDIARLVPAVLIGAGVIGLAAIMVNARTARRRIDQPADTVTTPGPEYADSGVTDTDNHTEENR